MPLKALVESKTDTQEELNDMALSKLPEIQSLALELFNSPRLDPDAIQHYIDAGFEETVMETGNIELAKAHWGQVAKFLSHSFDELQQMPIAERGEYWNIATSIIVAEASIQAEIESGATVEAVLIGEREGEQLKTLTRGISKEVLKDSPFEIKASIKARAKSRKEAAKAAEKV